MRSPPPRSRRRIRALAAVSTAVALLAPLGARAEESAPPFIVRDTRTASVALEDAARDLAGSEPRLGVLGIQKVLETVRDDLVADLVTPLQTRWIPAPEAARRLLLRQPPAVVADFDTIASPTARALLERAVAERDEGRLAEIVARFLPATPAIEASRLLAESQFERGAPLDAAVTLRRALRFAPGDVGLWRRLVDALDAAGDARGLAGLELPKAALDADAATGAPSLAARLEAARRRTGPLAEAALARARETAHAENSTYDHRLARRNWTAGAALPARTNDEELGLSPYEDDGGATMRFSERVRRLMPLFPTLWGRYVIVSDGFEVSALDLLSGRRAWGFPAEDKPVPGLPVTSPGRGALRGRTSLELRHAPFVADGRVYAVVETTAPYVPRDLSGVEITTYRPRRVLVALDAATGELAWSMGSGPRDAAALAGLSIASDPVVADGVAAVVLATWEKRWRVYLAAFDAATGALRWKREIVGGQQELNLFGEPIHELVAGTPAIADGVVYASTGLGVFAAADLRTGELRWLSSYPTTELRLVEVWFTTPMRFPTWGPAPVVAYGDAVVAAPGEGSNLLCFDRADGRLRWTAPSEAKRDSSFVDQFLGVTNDGKRDLAVVTGSSVRGLDLATGRLVWRERLPEVTFARGRGALSKTTVYVPTTRGLSRFSIPAEGRFLGDEPWPRGAGPGNVCLFPEVLVVAGRRAAVEEGFEPDEPGATGGPVQAFYDWEEIEARLAVRRAESPDDPAVVLDAADLWRVVGKDARAEPLYAEGRRLAEAQAAPALVERARRGVYLLHLDRGDAWTAERKVPDARTAFDRALAVASGAAERVEVRVRLDRLLDAAKLDTARTRNLEALAAEAGDVVAVLDPGEGEVPIRVAARVRLAALHRAAGRPAEAVDALEAILVEDATVAYGGEPARARATREIASIVRESGPAAYAKHEKEARRRLDAALAGSDAAPLERLLAEYPNASVVPGALLGLADRLEAAGSHAEAAAIYRRFLAAYPDRAETPTALARLARALAGARSVAPARATLATLERRHPNDTVTVDGVSLPTLEFVRLERERLGPAPAAPPEAKLAPPLSLKLEEAVETDQAGARVLPTIRAAGATAVPPVLVDVGSDVVALDGATATVRFRKPWGRSAGLSLLVGDVLVVTRPGELVALDPKSGQELWRRPVNGTPTALDGGLGQVLVAVKRPGERARWTISSLDPVSSDELWSRDIRDEPVEGLAVGEEGFVVVRRRSIPNAAGGMRTVLVLALHSLLSGEAQKEILLSAEGWTDSGWKLADPRTIVTTSAEGRTVRLDAIDLGTGKPRWSKLLEGTGRVRHLLPQGDTITVVGFEGRVRVLALETGAVRHETAIVGGVDTLFGTEPIVDGDRMYALLRTGGSTVLAAFDLTTGRAAWTTPTSVPVSEGWLRKSGDVLVTIQAPMRRRRGEAAAHLIAVSNARTGELIHRIDGEGLSGWRPSAALSDGSLVIVGEHAFAVYR